MPDSAKQSSIPLYTIDLQSKINLISLLGLAEIADPSVHLLV